MATTNLGRVAIVPQGAYSAAVEYKKLDLVNGAGGAYLYVNDTPSTGTALTDTDYWQNLVGNGITSILRTTGDGSPGTTDTYTITFTDDTTTTFTVWNGATGPAGTASASTVAVTPVGNVAATNVQAAIQELDTEKASQAHLTEKTGFGVISGLAVSAQTVPDMTVKVSAGVLYMADGTRFAPAAVASIAVTAADATNPRIDIVYVSSAGVVSYLAGTAAVTPSAPTTPAGGQKIAEISIPAEATSVLASNVATRRKNLWTEDWIYPTLSGGWSNASGSFTRYMKGVSGTVDVEVNITGGSLGIAVFTLPLGYRPSQNVSYAAGSSATYGVVLISGEFIVTAGVVAGNIRFNFSNKAV